MKIDRQGIKESLSFEKFVLQIGYVMKQCPQCHSTYSDDISFCLQDGSLLSNINSSAYDETPTVISAPKQAAAQPPAAQTGKWIYPLIGILSGLLIVFGFLALSPYFNKGNDNSNSVAKVNISNSVNEQTNIIANTGKQLSPSPSPAAKTNTSANVKSNTNLNSNSTSNSAPSRNKELGCRLSNDKGSENKVFIRTDCDKYDCDTDSSRIIGSLPDNTSIKIISGVSKIRSKVTNYSFMKVEILNSGQEVWVADTKVKCD